jgi:succinyl-diaminopimelate desuccinylase
MNRHALRLVTTFLCLLLAGLLATWAAPFAFAAPMNVQGSIPKAPGQAVLQSILHDIGKQRALVIEIQRELVARPALGPEAGGEGEEDKAAWLVSFLREKGIAQVERLDSVDRTNSLDPESKDRDVRPNIIVRHSGRDGLEKGRTLWLICHMHVAPPGPLDLWTHSPWKLLVKGDTLYGRGVMDNYQSITASLLLFESLTRNNITPPMNLGLVLHSQNSGFRHVLATRPELFTPGDLFLVPDHGNAQGSVMGIAEKGLLWLKLHIRGKQGHAATASFPSSALEAGSRLITSLPALAEQFPVADKLFAMPSSTITPTKAATSEDAVNAVAAEYVLYLDCRFVPPYTPDEVEQGLRRLADSLEKEGGVSIVFERLVAYPALPPSSAQSPVGLAIQRAVTAQLPQVKEVKAEGISTTTSAAFLRAKGFPVVT